MGFGVALRMDSQKPQCLKEIGQHPQDMITILDSNGKNLYEHLTNMRLSTLTMNKIFI